MNWVEAEFREVLEALRAASEDDAWLQLEPDKKCDHVWQRCGRLASICVKCKARA